MNRCKPASIAVMVLSGLLFEWTHTVSCVVAGEKPSVPDFTHGGKKGDGHDWNLGPIGARGWIYTAEGHSSLARQILVTEVAKGSPAAGVLNSGDVILGVGDQPFAGDARIEFARAIATAEQEQGGGQLKLICWRNGQTQNVQLKLSMMGSYSETAPYDCPKSKRVFELGCQAIAKAKLGDVSIPNNLNALALLASGREEYRPLLAGYARKVADYKADSMVSWYYGYATLFLAEYALATRDPSVMPGLQRLAKETAHGASAVGTWGHGFASPSGNCTGYGCMNLPGLTLLMGMVVAREAGVKDPEVDRVIAKASDYMRWYVNKGAIPYGDHAPWPGHEDNGKCSAAAVIFDLLGDREAAGFFAKMSTAAYDERERGHTGNFFNILWALPGVSRCGPLASGAYWKEHGWYYDLAREWDGRFGYQGSPQGEEEHHKYTDWDCTGAYMLTYALPLKSLYVTGKKPCAVPALNPQEVENAIAAGRDYFAARNGKGYQGRTVDQLLAGLSNWSPIVRLRSAQGLARQAKADVVPTLLKMLAGPDRNAQYGACEALEALKGVSTSAVPALQQTLQHEDLWLRIRAAQALSSIGKPAMAALPDLLRLLAKPSPQQDPRGMEQRYLCGALFDSRGGMLARSLEGVDREALYAAVRVGLRNEDGHARSATSSVYQNLSFEEIKPLLPAIHQAVVEAAPSGEMFADGVRVAGIRLLAKHRVEEGINACVIYARTQNQWASQERIVDIMKALESYGVYAKQTVPELKKFAEWCRTEEGFPDWARKQKREAVEAAIRRIEASTEKPELIRVLGASVPNR
jgi:HEAT repeat protein